ncbi:MAG: ArsR/SmtB family transcription factor [Candidatus Thorarchaeota archaeon]
MAVDYQELETLMKAFSSATRLQILDCLQRGINNSGKIAKELGLHRSTIEKHMKVLEEANVVKKIPSLTEKSQLTVIYSLQKNANVILATIKHLVKDQQ